MSRNLLVVFLIVAIATISVSCKSKEKEMVEKIEKRNELEAQWYEEHGNDYFETVDFSDFDV